MVIRADDGHHGLGLRPAGRRRADTQGRHRSLAHVSVWLTPMQYDPVPTLRWLDQQKLEPDRVIVQALDCGMTAFATKSAVLACAPNVAGKDPIGDVGEWAHARGIECWAALDTVLGRCYSLAHRPWTKSVFRKAESGEGEAPQTRRA